MEQTPRELARIAVDLGTEDSDYPNPVTKTQWPLPLRHKKPDFCALFAAHGLRQLDAYLAKWAAYDDYLARRSLSAAGDSTRPGGVQEKQASRQSQGPPKAGLR